MFGRRSDGKLVKNATPFRKFFPYLMKTRNEAQIFFPQKIDMTHTLKYLNQVNKGLGKKKLSLFHILLAAGVRTIALRPQLNWFVKGRRIYEHRHIEISFVVKKELKEEAGVSTAKITFEPNETLATVVEKVNQHLDYRRSNKKATEEKELDIVGNLPRIFTLMGVGAFKCLDYFGIAPKKMIKADPMYASVFLANLGSINMDAPYHHLYNWGTASLFGAFGKIQKEPFINGQGKLAVREVLDAKFTLDDRVTDGMYCGKAIELFVDFVTYPQKLEKSLDADTLARAK